MWKLQKEGLMKNIFLTTILVTTIIVISSKQENGKARKDQAMFQFCYDYGLIFKTVEECRVVFEKKWKEIIKWYF